jgi:tetratricopeptide (TPR) repeat protein
MLRLAVAISLLGCSEWQMRPTFPEEARGQPVIHEQALLGLSEEGDAAVAQLIDAEGAPAQLSLLIFDRKGGPSRSVLSAPPAAAIAVAQRVRQAGRRPAPILAAALAAEWPEGTHRATELGFAPRAPALPEPGRRRWPITGAKEIGSLPLALRAGETGDDPRALVLSLSERPGGTPAGDEVELARMPLSGASVSPDLWIEKGTVWLLAGSFSGGKGSDPLHRAVDLRRGSIARGEAQLHNAHGLADYAAGDLDAARREFDRAIAADASFVDGLYNAASAAALSDRIEEAVAYLRRAVAVDAGRVQVLGRNDDDLRVLRKRPDVRALLGLRRPPPEDVPPPP